MKKRIQLRYMAFMFILGGITVYASAFYTGLNDGTSSLVLAGIRSFALPLLLALALPPLFGLRGIWLTNPVAEVLTAAVLLGMTLRAKDRPVFYRGGEA